MSIRLEPGPGEPVITTRIVANHDPGPDHFIAVRGDAGPLTWDWGWPSGPPEDGSDRWTLVLTELPAGSFAYKILIDDATWQTGDNVEGTAGTDNETTPVF